MAELRVEGLSDGEVRVVSIPGGVPPHRTVVVTRSGARIAAYWNVCEHLPIPLDGGTGTIERDQDGRWVCNTHGAVYEPMSGRCVDGPCQGESLAPIGARWDGETVVLEIS